MPLYLPEKCLRGFDYCEPLAQIASDCGTSFVCCGKHDRSGKIEWCEDDYYTWCWKNDQVNECGAYSKRDFVDSLSVMAQGLSVIENKGIE